MKVAFISGVYKAKTIFGRMLNIYRARKAAVLYWQKGYAVICPHTNSSHFDGKAPDKVFLDGYLKLVEVSDVLVMLPSWLDSAGSRKEHKLATELRKEIFYYPPILS